MMSVKSVLMGGVIVLLIATGCTTTSPASDTAEVPVTNNSTSEPISTESTAPDEGSRVTGIEATPGNSGYSFAVTVESNDTGCDRYANWWEVVAPEGKLMYRRILAHSHVDEQPFTRSGGPVAVGEADVVVVRSHTNTDGYSTQAIKGSISEGFSSTVLPKDFAVELAEADPQPSDCAF